MSGASRDARIRSLIGELSEAEKATFVRGITLGALVGAALAGSVLRARRARRRPRPMLRVEAPDGSAVAPGEGATEADEVSPDTPADPGRGLG